MKPLIKWPGGKRNEIKYVEKMIPAFDRYIEPFFGGGALYFDLEPQKAVINDISGELMLFYGLLQGAKRPKFRKELEAYALAWERIHVYLDKFSSAIVREYNLYKHGQLTHKEFTTRIDALFTKEIIPFNGLFEKKFCIDQKGLQQAIRENLLAKLKRTKEKVDTKNTFSDQEIKKNIESAFRSGLYMHFRSLLNKERTGKLKITPEKKAANWYFIREFCYGGMFRYNKSGEFNIPYGGIAYNSKDFRAKVNHLFSEKIHRLLARTQMANEDFEKLLKRLKTTKKDFIFLDPPYDSEFSEYEENAFTKKDQKRLAKALLAQQAHWILIIKETDFIRSLYEKKGVHIERFSKTYLFNIKERNKRGVQHLLIHNLTAVQKTLR